MKNSFKMTKQAIVKIIRGNDYLKLDTLLKTHKVNELFECLSSESDRKNFLITWFEYKEKIGDINFFNINSTLFWKMKNEKVYHKITKKEAKKFFKEQRLNPLLALWFHMDGGAIWNDHTDEFDKVVNLVMSEIGDFFVDNERNIFFSSNGSIRWVNFFNNPPADLASLNKILGDERCFLYLKNFTFTDTKHSAFDKVFESWSIKNNDNKKMLLTLIGSLLMLKRKIGGVYFLTGGGANGKSKFLELIHNIVGKDYVNSAGNPAFLNQSSFELAQVVLGYRVVCYHELQKEIGKEATIILKQATDPKQKINLRLKHEKGSKANVAQNHIFASNHTISVPEHTEAVLRRFFWIPFNAKFNTVDQKLSINPNKLDVLFEDEQFLSAVRFQAVKSFFQNDNKIYLTNEAKNIKWKQTLSRVEQFVIDWKDGIKEQNTDREIQLAPNVLYSNSDVYGFYRTWARENGYMSLGRNNMLNELKIQKVEKKLIYKKVARNREEPQSWNWTYEID